MTPVPGAFWSAVVPALLLLFVLIAVPTLFRRREARLTEPSCRGCGYPVVGLPTTICPECGRDLLIVGVRWPGERSRWVAPLMVIGWLVVFPFLAAPVHRVAVSAAPYEVYRSFDITVMPVSESFRPVELSFEHAGVTLNAPPYLMLHDSISGGSESSPVTFDFSSFDLDLPLHAIQIMRSDAEGHVTLDMLRVEPDLSSYSVIANEEVIVEVTRPLGAPALANWLAADMPAHAELEDDSHELLRLIKSYQSGQALTTERFWNPSGSGAAGGGSGVVWWVSIPLFVFWLVCYVCGAILIGRRFTSKA